MGEAKRRKARDPNFGSPLGIAIRGSKEKVTIRKKSDDPLLPQWRKLRKELCDQGWWLPEDIHEIPSFLWEHYQVKDIYEKIYSCGEKNASLL